MERSIWSDVSTSARSKTYEQYHLNDRRKDDQEDPIDGFSVLKFESEEAMLKAWERPEYKEAAKIRETIMRETSVGVHATSLHEIVKII
jgi:hypothetical protein